jgi:hypothetical protein
MMRVNALGPAGISGGAGAVGGAAPGRTRICVAPLDGVPTVLPGEVELTQPPVCWPSCDPAGAFVGDAGKSGFSWLFGIAGGLTLVAEEPAPLPKINVKLPGGA